MKGWAKLAKRSLDEADLEYTQICEAEAVRDTSLLGESDDDSSQSSVPLSAQTSDVAWSAESRIDSSWCKVVRVIECSMVLLLAMYVHL